MSLSSPEAPLQGEAEDLAGGGVGGPGRAGDAAAPDEMTRTAAACSLCHDSAKTSEGAGYGELENPELDLVQVHLKEQAP